MGGIFSLLFSALPILFIFLVVSNAFKGNQNTTSRVKTTRSTKTSSKNISNRDRNKIDNKLKTYFENNTKLPIFEDIALQTQNGSYSVLEELVISKDDEIILKMDEFKNYYPDMYNQIVDLLLAFTKQKDEVLKAEVKQEKVSKKDILSDGQRYIDRINALNIEIPNEEITNGLYQTTALLKQIDLAMDGEADDKVDKLYDYYLPILINILENYKTLSKAGMQNEEFKENEVQLIKTIILINEALKTINASLHEDEYMNLQADITTLQSLLKKDGLVNPFEKEDLNGKK